MSNISTQHESVRQQPRRRQKQIDTSNHGFDIETLERELNAAKTKIVTLDTELKDKVQECSALWKRIQIFEERQNSEILDRYFPKQPNKNHPKVDDLGSKVTAGCSGTPSVSAPCPSSPQPWPCSYHSHQCFIQQCPCQSLHQLRHHCSPCKESLTKSRKFESTIEDVENLKIQINHIRELLNKQSDKAKDGQVSAAQTVEAPACTPVSPPPPSTSPDHNVSLASVEEFMDPFNNPVPSSSNHLNFQDQTIQLQ